MNFIAPQLVGDHDLQCIERTIVKRHPDAGIPAKSIAHVVPLVLREYSLPRITAVS
jgi:hypothetical protein